MRIIYPTVWKELTTVWEATFCEQLSNEGLGKPPFTGPNAYFDEELDWCTQNRRFFGAGGASRAASPPRAREGGGAGGRRASSCRELGKEAPTGGSPPPHFNVSCENHTNVRMQTHDYSFCM